MITVLHTIGEMGTGGAESLVVELVRRGPEVGWRSEVASAGGRREDELCAAGTIRAHRVPLSRRRPGGLWRAVRATRRAIRAADPDVIVAHNVGVTLATWVALRSLRRTTPLVTVFHGVAADDYRLSARLLDRAPDTVITVSEVIRDRLVAAGLRRAPEVIPNAVTPLELPDRRTARAELGLAAEARVALCAARLVEQKRHDVLLDAWRQVSLPDTVLLLAGDGDLRGEVEATVRESGLGERVQVLGARADMPRLLAAADLCVLASDWEGLPVVVLEAMAAHRPVVATDVDGVREVLRHGGGTLVPRRDPAALAGALTDLLADPARADVSGEQAAEVVRSHFDPAQMARRYDAVLRSLLPGVERTCPA